MEENYHVGHHFLLNKQQNKNSKFYKTKNLL